MKKSEFIERIKDLKCVAVRPRIQEKKQFEEVRCMDYVFYFVGDRFYRNVEDIFSPCQKSTTNIYIVDYPGAPTFDSPHQCLLYSDPLCVNFEEWDDAIINYLLDLFKWLSEQAIYLLGRGKHKESNKTQLIYYNGHYKDSFFLSGCPCSFEIPGVSSILIQEAGVLQIDDELGKLLSAMNENISGLFKDSLSSVLDDLEYEYGAKETIKALNTFLSRLKKAGVDVEVYRVE